MFEWALSTNDEYQEHNVQRQQQRPVFWQKQEEHHTAQYQQHTGSYLHQLLIRGLAEKHFKDTKGHQSKVSFGPSKKPNRSVKSTKES